MTTSLPLIIEPEDFLNLELPDNCVIIDLCREGSYQNGHIPGAIPVSPGNLTCGLPPAPGKIASTEKLDALFSALGHTEETHYIVYDDEGGGWAGRFIWTLDIIGHTKYSYLNGGLMAWNKAGQALETAPNTPTPGNASITINNELLVEAEDIIADIDTLQIWDARSPAEFRGEKVFAMRGGHMPGAKNAEWTTLMDAQRGYRIRLDAKEYLTEIGLDLEKPIVTHCQSHHRSGFTYLVGKHLGLDIKAYHGSWSEWGNREDTPIENN